MKKWTVVIMALVLLTVIGLASAAVPSISIGDITQGGGLTSSTGAALEDNFILDPTEASVAIQTVIKQMFDFVNGTSPAQPPAKYFTEEVLQLIKAKLPVTIPADDLVVNEIVPLYIANYDAAYGDVTKEFFFAVEYDAGKAVVVLLGLIDAAGNIEWIVVDAVAIEDGGLAVTFPQDVLLQMEKAADIMMVIFCKQ